MLKALLRDAKEKEIPLNQISVLYRASYHSNFVQAELLKRNVPYIVFGGTRFIERRHVKDIIAYLRIIFNPTAPVFMRIDTKIKQARLSMKPKINL